MGKALDSLQQCPRDMWETLKNSYTSLKTQPLYAFPLKPDRKISTTSEIAVHTHVCIRFATVFCDCLVACLSFQVRGWLWAPVPGIAYTPQGAQFMTIRWMLVCI